MSSDIGPAMGPSKRQAVVADAATSEAPAAAGGNADDSLVSCCACKERKPEKEFSKSQLRKLPDERKCAACLVGPVAPAALAPPLKFSNDGSFMEKVKAMQNASKS